MAEMVLVPMEAESSMVMSSMGEEAFLMEVALVEAESSMVEMVSMEQVDSLVS